MSHIHARAIERLVARLDTANGALAAAAESLPRVFADAGRTEQIGGLTATLAAEARAGRELLQGSAYEDIARGPLDDIERAVAQLRSTRRGPVQDLADHAGGRIRALDDALRTTRDSLVSEGIAATRARRDGARAATRERLVQRLASPAVVRSEAIALLERIGAPGAPLRRDLDAVGDLIDVAVPARAIAGPPTLAGSPPLDQLLARPPRTAVEGLDLRRFANAWRAQLDDAWADPAKLTAAASAIVARGADDLTAADWERLLHLLDADPSGAHLRLPHHLVDGTQPVAVVRRAALGDTTARDAAARHDLVESLDLTLRGADEDTSTLRTEARRILRRDPNGFGTRERARLHRIVELDGHRRMLGGPESDLQPQSARALARTLTGDAPPSAAVAVARELAPWLVGPRARVGQLATEHTTNAMIRSFNGFETIIKRAGGSAFTEDAPDVRPGRIARDLAVGAARGVATGVRDVARSLRVSSESVGAALAGGPLPHGMRADDLRRFGKLVRRADPAAATALRARLLSREVPSDAQGALRFLEQVRALRVDETRLSPEVRSMWRDALVQLRVERNAIRMVGALRPDPSFANHPDYGNVSRVRSALALVAADLQRHASTAPAATATEAIESVAPAPAVSGTTFVL